MKKQRRGLNRYNMLQDGKKREKASIHMHYELKTNCEEKNQEKKKKTLRKYAHATYRDYSQL